jgi:putative tryptophan/tyrosine transport system substrate-binding protein
MKRREFITLVGGAATWPFAARAQQANMPVLGFLGSASEARYGATRTAIRRGLNEAGFVEKQNLLIEYRWADFRYDRLPALAADLVTRRVDVIFTTGSVVSLHRAWRADQLWCGYSGFEQAGGRLYRSDFAR